MKATNNMLSVIFGGTALATSSVAQSDTPDRLEATSYAWRDPQMKTEIGVSVLAGGGVGGFTNRTMRDVTPDNVAGLWNVRATFGSHIPVGLDVAYIGTGASLKSLAGTSSATLVGSTFEGALRWNVLPHYAWNPYGFAGIGWQRYDVTGATFSRSDNGINDSDNSIVFPLGAGIAYRDASGFVADIHGVFRVNANAGLVIEGTNSSNFAPLHTWEASAAAGYEF